MSTPRDREHWRLHGVRVVRGSELDPNTAQTPGMSRAAAITHARAGAEKLWAGTVTIHPSAKTGAHHHGALESIILHCVVPLPRCTFRSFLVVLSSSLR